jgi:hypothetical protein
MGRLIPVDYTEPFNATDVICCVCRKPFGGLIYDPDEDVFRHRDPDECDNREGKFLRPRDSV